MMESISTAHLDQLEKTYVLEALKRTDGNQTSAADLLKMSVRSLRHLLDKHGIPRIDRTDARTNARDCRKLRAAAQLILIHVAGPKTFDEES